MVQRCMRRCAQKLLKSLFAKAAASLTSSQASQASSSALHLQCYLAPSSGLFMTTIIRLTGNFCLVPFANISMSLF